MIGYEVKSIARESKETISSRTRKFGYLYLRQGGRLGPLIIAIIAAVFALEAQERQFGTLQAPGPAMWPTCIGIITVVLSICAAIVARDTPALFRPKGLLRVILYMLAMGLFVLLYPTLGFIISSMLMSFMMLYLAGRIKWYTSVIISLLVAVSVFVLFGMLLELPITPWP